MGNGVVVHSTADKAKSFAGASCQINGLASSSVLERRAAARQQQEQSMDESRIEILTVFVSNFLTVNFATIFDSSSLEKTISKMVSTKMVLIKKSEPTPSLRISAPERNLLQSMMKVQVQSLD